MSEETEKIEERPKLEIPDELKELEQRFVGKKVLICGDHPHADRVGIVNRLDRAHAINRWGFVVRFDDNQEAFVFEGNKHWKVLDETPTIRFTLTDEERADGWETMPRRKNGK